MMIVFDLIQHKVIASMPVGRDPDSVAVDPVLHRIYTAGLDGKLVIVQQDGANAYRIVDDVATHFGAHTIAVDPASHKVYVGYASLFVAPRVAVFSEVP